MDRPYPRDIPVVILCGGRGTRIGDVTQQVPKPLVRIGDHPILWHIMRLYRHHGFRRFILCLGYKGHLIEEYFHEHHAQDVTLVDTGPDTATGARVRRIRPYLDQDLFMLTYGDGVGDVDLCRLLNVHRSGGRIGTVTGVHPPSRFGELHVAHDVVTDFREKPTLLSVWASGGFFVFQREFVEEYLDDDPELILEQEPLRKLAASAELTLYRHEGFWRGMDTIHEWSELTRLWQSGVPPWHPWGESR